MKTKEEKISDGRKKNGKIYGRNGFGIMEQIQK